MKAVRLAMAIVALATLGAAAPLSPQATSDALASNGWGSCQEECAISCGERYPDDANLRNICTTSCISYECGGGDYP